jgi:hypothetical protein
VILYAMSSLIGPKIQKSKYTRIILTEGYPLGGLVVSVLATGPKVRRFKPSRGRWILRVIKSAARPPPPSEGSKAVGPMS